MKMDGQEEEYCLKHIDRIKRSEVLKLTLLFLGEYILLLASSQNVVSIIIK
jgi:hypothetical protein